MAKQKSVQKSGVDGLDGSPSHLLQRATQVALDLFAEEFGGGGLTQRQYAVLAAAAENEGATQTDLVRVTGIDRSTLADMVSRMIGKGLLERERAQHDARANAVRLTELGRSSLDAARPKMAAADARLLKLISGRGRRDAFAGLLAELVSEAQRKAEKREAKRAPAPKLVLSEAVEPAKEPRKKTKKAA
ncbi:MarR family winged helix-turn-helix transcriptional regulator [Phenylobacterium deserti]|uniref:MarR family transcriptional regulator n=1 Tax=Phenylobacterium deserti TaxID=1914756 RepID=A0A328AX44_9CAUL|nr:MarR family winged helix-turn-helix transcriptional regulator [Phenylobacterium deserti]RAK57428.1 MarR family transcriptional regulator [Phenylobacterium deserti]